MRVMDIIRLGDHEDIYRPLKCTSISIGGHRRAQTPLKKKLEYRESDWDVHLHNCWIVSMMRMQPYPEYNHHGGLEYGKEIQT